MTLIRNLLIAFLSFLSVLCVQAQNNFLHAYLPSDAKAVVNINLASLASKMSWQEFQQLSFFQQAMKDAPPDVHEFLKNPAASGINFLNDLFIVMIPAKDEKAKPNAILYGTLTDTAKFRSLVQKIDPKSKVKTVGKIALLASDKSSVAWTSGLFAMQLSKNKKPKPVAASTKTPDLQAKELISQYQALLTPSVNPLTKDQRFASLMNESGDIRFWINRNFDAKKIKKNKADEILKMMNWSMMQNGNFMTGVVRFEKGQALVSMKTFMNEKMDSLYRLYPSKSLNANLLKKLPAGQPLVLLSFNMSTEMIAAMFKESGMEKMMDSLSQKSKINLKDIEDGLNGDLSLAVIKSTEVDEKDSVTQAIGGIQFFIAASVKNKSKLESLMAQLQKPKEPKADQDSSGRKGGGPLSGMKPSLLLNDSFFVAAISSFAAEKFLQSNADNDVSKFVAPYAAHSSLFSLDLKTIIGFAMQMNKKKPADNEGTSKLAESFDKLVFYGGEYQDGACLSAAELQFSNKDESSLKQFVSLIELAMNMKGKKSSSNNPGETHTDEIKEENTATERAEIVEETPPPPPKTKNENFNQEKN